MRQTEAIQPKGTAQYLALITHCEHPSLWVMDKTLHLSDVAALQCCNVGIHLFSILERNEFEIEGVRSC